MATNETAVVTLVIGEQHLSYWRKYCQPTWETYARKSNYDLIVISEPLDKSAEASSRSPAWQKCLVLSQPFAAQYRQIVLLDSDIVINAAAAPKINEQVSIDQIGGVISGSQIHDDLRLVLLNRLTGQPVTYEREQQQWHAYQAMYYSQFGLPPIDAGIVQTGVLVASPLHHGEIFEGAYRTEFADVQHRSFEQVPLSHAILSSGLFRQIDTRFNSVFYETMLVTYPYLLQENLPIRDLVAMCAVQAEFANNFFLHLAYKPDLARYLAPHSRGE
jgi:hypothetical protein